MTTLINWSNFKFSLHCIWLVFDNAMFCNKEKNDLKTILCFKSVSQEVLEVTVKLSKNELQVNLLLHLYINLANDS